MLNTPTCPHCKSPDLILKHVKDYGMWWHCDPCKSAYVFADRRLFEKDNKPTTGWISVKDKLPKDNEIVLIFNPPDHTLKIRICQYSNWSHCSDGITHWQPLPEPPQ